MGGGGRAHWAGLPQLPLPVHGSLWKFIFLIGHISFRIRLDSMLKIIRNYINPNRLTVQVRIRPERRDGKLVIRADIRSKEGGKFRPEVYWRIPGEKKLADQLGLDVYTPLGTRHGSGPGV